MTSSLEPVSTAGALALGTRPESAQAAPDLRDWGSVRSQFALDPEPHPPDVLPARHAPAARARRDRRSPRAARREPRRIPARPRGRSERRGARRGGALPRRAGIGGCAHRLDDDGTRAPLHAARARPGRRGRDDRARLLRNARVAPALGRACPTDTALRRREARLRGRDREPCPAGGHGADARRRAHVGALEHGSPAAPAGDRTGAAGAGARVRRRRARLRRSRRDRTRPRLRRVRLRLPQVALRAARDGRAVGERARARAHAADDSVLRRLELRRLGRGRRAERRPRRADAHARAASTPSSTGGRFPRRSRSTRASAASASRRGSAVSRRA